MGTLLARFPLLLFAADSIPPLLQGQDHSSQIAILRDTFRTLGDILYDRLIDVRRIFCCRKGTQDQKKSETLHANRAERRNPGAQQDGGSLERKLSHVDDLTPLIRMTLLQGFKRSYDLRRIQWLPACSGSIFFYLAFRESMPFELALEGLALRSRHH